MAEPLWEIRHSAAGSAVLSAWDSQSGMHLAHPYSLSPSVYWVFLFPPFLSHLCKMLSDLEIPVLLRVKTKWPQLFLNQTSHKPLGQCHTNHVFWNHIFISYFVLLLFFQWQSGRKTDALPTTVMLQLTRQSGFWLLFLPAKVLFSVFLLCVWLRLGRKWFTKAVSLSDLLNNLPALSYVSLPTLFKGLATK